MSPQQNVFGKNCPKLRQVKGYNNSERRQEKSHGKTEGSETKHNYNKLFRRNCKPPTSISGHVF